MSSARQLFDDLLTVEVNTVIKPGMTGRKMPSTSTALVETLALYEWYTGTDHDRVAPDGRPLADGVFTRASVARVEEAAERLRFVLAQAKGDRSVAERARDLDPVVLRRIQGNAEQIRAMVLPHDTSTLRSTDVLDLDPDDVLRVRKIWELGLESVVMQSVIQVDGDVVTRVPSDEFAAAHAAMLDVHRAMTGRAIEHYQFLIKAAWQFLHSFANFFKG